MPDESEHIQDTSTTFEEKSSYESLIMNNIKTFYSYMSKPRSDNRNKRLIAELNKMMYIVQIFEDEENIKKEFDLINEVYNKENLTMDDFEHFLNLHAIACQRIWHRKGLLLTQSPYKENILKDVTDDWRKEYPDKFKEGDA